MILNSCNECRLPYNQMIIMTLGLCCIVIILIIVQSEELQNSPLHKPFMKWNSQPDKVNFYQLDSKNWTYIISDKFLSFSIDSSEIYHGFRNPSLVNKALIRLISHLGGGYLRLGGQTSDRVVFSPASRAWPNDYLPVDSGLCGHELINCPNATQKTARYTKHVFMSADNWIKINEFCQATGMKLLFDLNVLLRTNDSNSSWDPRNAELLLDYSFSQGYHIDWELGNEPNLFPHVFGVEVEPDSLAVDYSALRQLLNRYTLYENAILIGPSTTNPEISQKSDPPLKYLKTFLYSKPDVNAVSWHFVEVQPGKLAIDYTILRQLLYRYTLYKDSLLIGPSSTRPKLNKKLDPPLEYLKTFLAHGGDVDAVSWHFYYMGPNATVDDFLNPSLYDSLRETIDVVKQAVKDTGVSPLTPIWIGETGSTYGGGAYNLSDRFVASLLHLDKLGTSASHGVSVVVRQSLYRGYYRLLDPDNMFPYGDYWVSILFKKLVGRKVLNISEMPGVNRVLNNTIPLRLYAHCSTYPPYPVIYGINLNNETLGISLFSNNSGHLFSVTGYPNHLSMILEMNGKILKLEKNQALPKFTPVTIDLREPVPVRPYSLFFLISFNHLPICASSNT